MRKTKAPVLTSDNSWLFLTSSSVQFWRHCFPVLVGWVDGERSTEWLGAVKPCLLSHFFVWTAERNQTNGGRCMYNKVGPHPHVLCYLVSFQYPILYNCACAHIGYRIGNDVFLVERKHPYRSTGRYQVTNPYTTMADKEMMTFCPIFVNGYLRNVKVYPQS